MLSVFMICMAIYGNGVKTAGWTIIHLPPGMTAHITTKIVPITWLVVDPGTSLLRYVEVNPGCESCKQMQMK
jgi:hypothetical protein